jgi:hypothetical protein
VLKQRRMLDLFAGQLGWSKAFLARGWEVVAIDLVRPAEIPKGCTFIQRDILDISSGRYGLPCEPDFICASSPCEEFSVHGMPHFHPNPKYPELGIKFFEHTRAICEASGVPYVMENVRTAQQFVGPAENHCGPFYLWGNAVPPIFPQGISKAKWYRRAGKPGNFADALNLSKSRRKALLATIPPELANCVAEYAERIIEAEERLTG